MKKISLKSLKIKSFVTEENRDKMNTIKGGWSYDYDYHQNCGGSDSCWEPYTDKCPTIACSRNPNC
ncbi:MAG: pinensin family lanthipeptide [Bacteroidota bacterium]